MEAVDDYHIPPRLAFREVSAFVLECYRKRYPKKDISLVTDLMSIICCFVNRRPIPKGVMGSPAQVFFHGVHEAVKSWMKENRKRECIPKEHHGHRTRVFSDLAEALSQDLVSHMRRAHILETISFERGRS